MKEFYMGMDIDSIEELSDYLTKTYGAINKDNKIFKKHVGYGDDVMNTVEISADIVRADKRLQDLLDWAVEDYYKVQYD